MASQARTEFSAALNQLCTERGLDPSVVIETIKIAILAAFRKDHPEMFESLEEGQDPAELVDVEINSDDGTTLLFQTVNNEKKDITPPGFGRIAAQTAKQVILQRVREAEKTAIVDDYRDKVGEMITGMVLRFDGKNVIFDIGRGQGYMPPEDQMRSEFYKMNQRMAVYVKDIRETMRGETIIVSRSVPELVIELFKREVPEVNSGAVEVKAIAREAGVRTKISVHSTQAGVDPVGSCVGQKGVRVQEIINELNNEKIDIIQFSEDQVTYIAASLAPADNLSIELDEELKLARVTVPDDQLSLAIGRGGQNVRLAAKLTGYKIDLVASGGQQLSVTGEEEFEIDQLGLSAEIREILVENSIKSLYDLEKRLHLLEAVENVDKKMLDKITAAYDVFRALSTRKEYVAESDASTDEPISSDEADKLKEGEVESDSELDSKD